MKLQTFMITHCSLIDSSHTVLALISFDCSLKKDGNDYPQGFFKQCKYIKKKVIRHTNNNLSDSSYSDESDEEQI